MHTNLVLASLKQRPYGFVGAEPLLAWQGSRACIDARNSPCPNLNYKGRQVQRNGGMTIVGAYVIK
jgi:hypothetical protein